MTIKDQLSNYMAAIYYYNRSIYIKRRTDQNVISSLSTFDVPAYVASGMHV